jgi:hypothetical protein
MTLKSFGVYFMSTRLTGVRQWISHPPSSNSHGQEYKEWTDHLKSLQHWFQRLSNIKIGNLRSQVVHNLSHQSGRDSTALYGTVLLNIWICMHKSMKICYKNHKYWSFYVWKYSIKCKYILKCLIKLHHFTGTKGSSNHQYKSSTGISLDPVQWSSHPQNRVTQEPLQLCLLTNPKSFRCPVCLRCVSFLWNAANWNPHNKTSCKDTVA